MGLQKGYGVSRSITLLSPPYPQQNNVGYKRALPSLLLTIDRSKNVVMERGLSITVLRWGEGEGGAVD